ncbi:hypothetical protein SAMN05660420_00856 [Desulfuromusa kysingii]|uniref:EF-hand domain-containing protein n=1 Tax=Desulfuromusa kysingii TaxID=37625 RepID=A0A1H3X8M2_9BACT|nr:hypothetical protein [Desulfuromusa kysingii]SDZ95271.1 hypothetical protein SAMN05660420_00856 [Desulfuromusa kysingii]
MPQLHYLIVQQQLKPAENLPEVLKELAQKFQLDIYLSRQLLTGRGLSLLTKGSAETLGKISKFLQSSGVTHWLVEPSKAGFVPLRIRNLQINPDKITFGCQKKDVVFSKGATILAIFAEITGELADRSVKQLLSSHAYRGRDDIRRLEAKKIHKIILQGKPVLDLYLLDEKREVKDAVRIFPGKFDPQGLGQRATLSSRQNLEKILELAEEYAGDFHLQTDFGLVNFPGTILRREDLENPETQRQNLLSLARYGWLMADLLKAGPISPPQEEQQEESLGQTATAAILMQNQALNAAEEMADLLPLSKRIGAEIDQATTTEAESSSPATRASDPGLPPPPPAKSGIGWSKPSFWFGSAGAVLFIAIFSLSQIFENDLLNQIAYSSFASGAIPLLIATLFLWYGFYFLRMKRQIENTPTSKVRSAAMGMVEVKGQAIRRYALISPMSNTPCVFYRLTKYRRDKNNQWRISSVSSSDNVPFLLEDDTGRVEINPTGCRVSAGTKQEGSPGQIGLLRGDNDSDDKWVEEVIVDGTLIYVLGYAAVKKAGGQTMAEKKIAALRALKQNPQDLKQYDVDGDGAISAEEWDAARSTVGEQVLRESLQKQQQRRKQEEHIVIGKKKGRPLIITETHSEDSLTSRYLYYSIPLFFAAAAATAGAIYLLLKFLK